MKKAAILFGSLVSYLTLASSAFAIEINPPALGIDPRTKPGVVISNALTIVYIAAALVVLFFLVLGAFRWITSGGDKDAIGKARGTIINALVGLAILALSFLIVAVVGSILNINILNQDFNIPNLQGGNTGI